MEKTQFNVKNIPPDLMAKAKRLAEQNDRALSLIIRDLLREWVKREEAKLTPQK